MRELQARMDSREFSEWIAYWKLEPWGLSDALIRGWTEKKRKTPQEMWSIIRAAAGAARTARGGANGNRKAR